MKVSNNWLREWIDPPVDAESLAVQLTMAGLEVGAVERISAEFSGVVVGRVRSVMPHPDAETLSVCMVDVGEQEPAQIVCGATNVRADCCYPVATPGARLPGGVKIRATKLRGMQSQGMLCSETELGLGQDSEGIMELAPDAPVGQALESYLALDDVVLELELTPNRGDCLGIQGVAREVAALNRMAFEPRHVPFVDDQLDLGLPVELQSPQACPRYLGRVIQGVDPSAVTPEWMRERLRRSGLRPLHPIVDVTNYVLLELGQPMHAFDLDTLQGGIRVRQAVPGEKLVLLDEREVTLEPDVLVIADHARAVAMAGIMGGLHSAVGDHTTSILLESAFFSPLAIAGKGRRYGLHTDASHRFERGVDPDLQRRALERATDLVVQIAGGKPGAVIEAREDRCMPVREQIPLRRDRLALLLGLEVPGGQVTEILRSLGLDVAETAEGWVARPPSYRFDLEIEADLIEEVARLVGFDAIPETSRVAAIEPRPASESAIGLDRVRDQLAALGYQEAVTYSFVDPGLQQRLFPDVPARALSNPISADLSVMRVSLWPGLLGTLVQNASRQQERVKIFECGVRFVQEGNDFNEINTIAGLVSGDMLPEQWGVSRRSADFFDIKSDVESILRLGGDFERFEFAPGSMSALHPGQSARITDNGVAVGWIGELHPALQQQMGLRIPVFLFELDASAVTSSKIPSFSPISRFPRVRRDLAFVVPEATPAAALLACARQAAGDLLAECRLFDVYQGKGIDSGLKSVALGLILQESSRTLTDQEADEVVTRVGQALRAAYGASLRE